MKIGTVIQTRTSSTRLSKKVLKELPYKSGITVLEQVIRRMKKSKKVDEIIIATTLDDKDDEVVEIAKKENVRWFRGSKEDVLSRYYLSAKENGLDVIARVTSDCPCTDAKIVDMAITEHIREMADFTIIKNFPRGLDVEIINFAALEKANKNANKDYEREHVTPYVIRRPSIFKIIQIEAPKSLNASSIRVTLDTEEDYILLCVVFDCLYYRNEYFGIYDIVNLFREKPWLKLINAKVWQKRIFDTLKAECEAAVKILDLQDLKKASKFLRISMKKLKINE